jgi:hypothetical protein
MEHPERTLRAPLRVRVRPAPLVLEDRALHRHRERLAPMNLAEASSEGNANVPGHEGVKFGLNVYWANR